MAFVTPTDVATGEVLTASRYNQDVVANMEALPRGYLAKAQITANSSAFTTIADISGLSVTYTQQAGRTYLTLLTCEVSSTVTADTIVVTLADGSNNALARCPAFISVSTLSEKVMISLYEVAATTGSVTRKIRANRNSGSGTSTIQAGATFPAQIVAMDVGV